MLNIATPLYLYIPKVYHKNKLVPQAAFEVTRMSFPEKKEELNQLL